MSFTIDTASDQDVQQLGERLEAFNAQQTGIEDCQPIRLAMHDADGALVGGLQGVTNFGWLYIAVLWIDEPLRGQGLGTRLLTAAEEEAVRRGCGNACLTTFSFQSRPFYLRRGYEEFGQLEDYPQRHVMHFMRKRL